jgi:lipopolysaccharide export system permease protein
MPGETPVLFGFLRRNVYGILPRYIIGQVLKAFTLALLTLSSVIVLFTLIAKAAELGATPGDIARLVPLIVPGTLPYTIPVALLFAVSVVYGRVASDNEVVAVKAAGLGAMTVLWPSLWLGLALSVTLFVLSGEFIPRANHAAKVAVFRNLEDAFYKLLKKEREWPNKDWPFFIRVKDVEDKTLIGAYFMHRSTDPKAPNTFDLTVYAEKATIRFDTERGVAHVYLVNSEIQGGANQPDVGLLNREHLELPFNRGKEKLPAVPVQELTTAELAARQADRLRLMSQERRRQSGAAALWIASGRLGLVDWPHIRAASSDYDYWRQDYKKLETEKHTRIALAGGAFFFVLLGAPVGILFARRDFLSAFISCFVPIILIYYPLMLMGMNLGKEGLLEPWLALLFGNAALALLAGFFALPPVLRH